MVAERKSKKPDNVRIISFGLPVVLMVIFIWWKSASPSVEVNERIPGLDNRIDTKNVLQDVNIGEFIEDFDGEWNEMQGSWPRFRGNDFDNICKDPTPLADTWPSNGPTVIWQHPMGEGYAAPVIHKGKVYLLDYDEKEKADALRCFSLQTGDELWRRWYNVSIKRHHGISRTIPAVTDDFLLSIGPKSHVMCLHPENGDLLWTLDLEKDYLTETPEWHTGQCPLIYNDVAILAPGGKAIMIGVDCATGEVLWETPNPDSLKMSHSSIIPITLHGKRMFVYNAIGGICGISAEGEDIGELLWMNKEWSPAVMAPSPIHIGNNELVVMTCYGAGGGRIKVNKTNDGYEAVLVEKHNPREGIASDQQTPIMLGEYLWVILPKDAGILSKQLACYHISDLNNPVWISGKENRYGIGPYIVCRDKLYLFNDDGELFMFTHKINSVTLLDSFKVIDGFDAWGPMALADGYLLVRDSRNLLCLYVGI